MVKIGDILAAVAAASGGTGTDTGDATRATHDASSTRARKRGSLEKALSS